MTKFLLRATVTALALAPVAANAAIRYDFVALSSFPAGPVDDQITGSFSYISPTYVNASVPPANLINCTITGSVSGVIPCGQTLFQQGSFGQYDQVAFGVAFPSQPTYQINYYFALGAFSAPGFYQTIQFGANQAGTLRVTDLGVGGPVPEPASWAMMIAGFGLVGGAMRRRVTKISYA